MFSKAEMVVEVIMTKSVLLMNHSFEGSNASSLETTRIILSGL